MARKYEEFIEEKGYIPEMFQPFNKQELDDVAPTLTGRCSVSGGMSAVLKLEEPLKVKVATKQGYEEAEHYAFADVRRRKRRCNRKRAHPQTYAARVLAAYGVDRQADR